MGTFKYKEFSDDKFEIVGKDEVIVATVERGEDNLWRILPKNNWSHHRELDFGPFNSNEEAFEALGAAQADQS